MTINKLTLAAALTIGLMAGTMNSGIASNVDIFSNYSRVELPMRWEVEMKPEDIPAKKERFYECSIITEKAYQILERVLQRDDVNPALRENLSCFCECLQMGAMLCDLLYKYMVIYEELNGIFAACQTNFNDLTERINTLKREINRFHKYVTTMDVAPVDKFEGIFIRRKFMADFLDYNTTIMLYSIQQNKRIPEGLRDAIKHDWY